MPYLKTPTQKYRLYLIKRALRHKPRGDFLEVGCGLGFITAQLQAMGFRGQGIDPSAKSIALAKRFHPRSSELFSQQDLDAAVRAGRTYHLIVMAEVLEHIPDDLAALRNIHRLLQPGGLFVLTVPAHRATWTVKDKFAGHLRHYERASLAALLVRAGFSIEQFYSFGYPLFTWTSKVALKKALKRQAIDPDYLRNDQSVRATDSGHTRLIERELQQSHLIFNDFFIRPMFWLQNLWLHTDRGPNYLILAQKK